MSPFQIVITEKFKSDVGFNLICQWLRDNCFAEENRNYFNNLTPFHEITKIQESQAYTDEFFAASERKIPVPMGIVPSIYDIISVIEVEGSQLNPAQFRDVYKILHLSHNLKSYLVKNNFPKWYEISRGLYASNKSLTSIQRVFDDDYKIKWDASPILKNLYCTLQKKQGRIKQTMQKIFLEARENDWLEGDKVALRQGRSVLPLKANRKSKIKGIVQDQSATGQTVFIEPLAIIELNNSITALQFAIREEESRILTELTAFFHPIAQELSNTAQILHHIDRHVTIANFSNKLDAIAPELNNLGILKLDTAENPQFTLLEKPVIPLSIELKEEKILLLSGPNSGGKTVVLKSIGLYCVMAQCGLYIPAQKAILPIFKEFMADIGDRQSIDDDLSTFSAHMQSLTDISRNATPSSLILLDELGTGTDPEAGAAISRAILEKLLERRAIVLATTHLGALKLWAAEHKGITNGSMSFDSEILLPTYALQLGKPGASYALEISERMGLPKDIISRSGELIGDRSVQLEHLLSQIEREHFAIQKMKSELEAREKEQRNADKEIQLKKKEVEEIHNNAMVDANRKAEEILTNSRKKIEQLVAEIRKKQADYQSIKNAREFVNKKLKEIQNDLGETEKYHSVLSIKDLKPGMIVYIPKLKSEGQILSVPDKKGRVRVEANGISIRIKFDELSKAEQPIEGADNKFSPSNNKVSSPKSLQLDLRGKRVQQAVEETIVFLDGALLAGLNLIYILHGKGTGALMKAIHEYLSSQSFISQFYFANENQGGAGITIVELK